MGKEFTGKHWNALMNHCYKEKTPIFKKLDAFKYPVLSNGYLYFTNLIGIVRVPVGVYTNNRKIACIRLSEKILTKDSIKVDANGITVIHKNNTPITFEWVNVTPEVENVQLEKLFDSLVDQVGKMSKEKNTFYAENFAIDTKYVAYIAELSKSLNGFVKIIPAMSDTNKNCLPIIYVEYLDKNQEAEMVGIYAPIKLQ